MSDLLLDTSIVLPFTRKSSNFSTQLEADFEVTSSAFRPVICVVTLGEMRAFAKAWGAQRVAQLAAILATFPVADINRDDVLEAYAVLHDLNKSGGCGIGQNDLWIGAAARAADLAVLTSDTDLLRLPAGTLKIIQVNAKTGVTETSRT